MATNSNRFKSSGLGMHPTSPRQRSRAGVKPRPVLDEEGMEEVKAAFNLFDNTSKGTIDIREIKAAFRALGFQVKKSELRTMLTEIGKETASTIAFSEFLDMVTPRILSRDPREEIHKIFALFDEDNTGGITFQNLKKVANELGEKLSDAELQEMIDEADRDGDGVVNEEEFYRVMRKREHPLDDLDTDDDEEF